MHGAWCWRDVSARLRAEGHTVFTPTLTGQGERRHQLTRDVGVATHVDDLTELLWFEDLRDVYLGLHSYSGVLAGPVVEHSHDRITSVLGVGGLLITLAAMSAYVLLRARPAVLPDGLTTMGAVAFMGIGIAMSSASLWVAIVMVFVWLGHWLHPETRNQERGMATNWPTEAAVGLGVLLTLLTMMELRGALPVG